MPTLHMDEFRLFIKQYSYLLLNNNNDRYTFSEVKTVALSAKVEKDGVFSTGALIPNTSGFYKPTVKSNSSSSNHSASSGEQIGLLELPYFDWFTRNNSAFNWRKKTA